LTLGFHRRLSVGTPFLGEPPSRSGTDAHKYGLNGELWTGTYSSAM
jgi:hypothetical protein